MAGQQLGLPPETGIGIVATLPGPTAFHLIEAPPLYVAVDEKDISPGGSCASSEVVSSVVDLPTCPTSAGCLGEVGCSFPSIAGGDVGYQLNSSGRTLSYDDGSDPFGTPVFGAPRRARSSVDRINEPIVSHNAMIVFTGCYSLWLGRLIAFGRTDGKVLSIAPKDDSVSLTPRGAVEDVSVEGTGLQDDIRRPV